MNPKNIPFCGNEELFSLGTYEDLTKQRFKKGSYFQANIVKAISFYFSIFLVKYTTKYILKINTLIINKEQEKVQFSHSFESKYTDMGKENFQSI